MRAYEEDRLASGTSSGRYKMSLLDVKDSSKQVKEVKDISR